MLPQELAWVVGESVHSNIEMKGSVGQVTRGLIYLSIQAYWMQSPGIQQF